MASACGEVTPLSNTLHISPDKSHLSVYRIAIRVWLAQLRKVRRKFGQFLNLALCKCGNHDNIVTAEGENGNLIPQTPHVVFLHAFFVECKAMYDWAEFRHFRYLLTVLEKQGFRAAAEILHTAQPNLSIQARQFQENASIRLFRRTRNGRIRPTEAGTAFISLAHLLLDTRDEIIDALVAIERGTIVNARFGCSSFVDPKHFRMFCGIHKELVPSCQVHSTHGDTPQLAEEVAAGTLDAALVTMPLEHPSLCIEEVSRHRLVACLRRDDPLANKASLQPADLERNLSVLFHPRHHPRAHARLIEQLRSIGVEVRDHSRASHPSELLMLVRDGHGIALIREGMPLDETLTTRRIADVDWTSETAAIYHRLRYPKTIPLLVKQLRKALTGKVTESGIPPTHRRKPFSQAQTHERTPVQLKLLGE